MTLFFYKCKGGLLPAFFLLFTLAFTACNRKIAFNTSTIVPAAEGYVKVKKDNNGNHAINVDVKNLANPRRLPVPQSVYMVWVDSPEGLKKLGQLKSGSGLFSNTLKASLRAITPVKPTRLFITAESDAGVQYPGSQTVLTTNTF